MNRNYAYVAAGSVALVALLALLNWYFTPSLTIDGPTAGASVCEPVPVAVSWGGRLMNMEATLNGRDVTNVPLTLDQNKKTATATTDADMGPRTVTVSGDFKPRFLGGFYPIKTITETRSFTVKRPDLAFVPTSVSVSQPGTQQATMSRACMSTAKGLIVTMLSNATSVAKPSQTSVTLAPQQAMTAVQVTAGTRPGLAKISGSAQHHLMSFTSAVPLDVHVKRATGSFVRLDPAFATPSGKQDSPSGEFSVHISTAIVNPSVPPPYASFDAQFKKGTSSTSDNLASAIRFSTASAGGGAGFCARSSLGAVFSGYPQGHPSDYVYSLVDLRSDHPSVREFEVDSETANAATGAPFLYRPTLLVSPDCSLVIVAGAHPNSTQEPHWLRAVDVITGAGLPGCELAFGGLENATDLTAKVVDTTNGRQRVDISVGSVVIGMCSIP
jgi:hypothetical protein